MTALTNVLSGAGTFSTDHRSDQRPSIVRHLDDSDRTIGIFFLPTVSPTRPRIWVATDSLS